MNISEILAELNGRLPEITWKLNQLQTPITVSNLPRGLFTIPFEADSSCFIAEIKSDINRLTAQKNELAIRHLADLIHRKINVLVKICQINQRKASSATLAGKGVFNLSSFSTRQQWLQEQEERISLLTEQKQALLGKLENKPEPSLLLSLQGEIGQLEKQLTLAKEAYQKATRVY